ncbi:hypothetical protein ND991_18000 [Gordonia sputi]|uniref:hypothetical protein n=1 Tax=Gordonia sputi TaxID=36823 RepID=UPI0020440C5B|nr:hypothetical protein [Gordonia sputi]MCM3897102.1 hypothetical protein [Gordonia sputi]
MIIEIRRANHMATDAQKRESNLDPDRVATIEALMERGGEDEVAKQLGKHALSTNEFKQVVRRRAAAVRQRQERARAHDVERKHAEPAAAQRAETAARRGDERVADSARQAGQRIDRTDAADREQHTRDVESSGSARLKEGQRNLQAASRYANAERERHRGQGAGHDRVQAR